MREFLTTGFFGAILGLCIGTSASASIISRGFLDEALENYATNTALDLKANQSDFTDLSNIVGTPAELTYRDIMGSGDGGIAELMGSTYYYSYGDNTVPTNNISELINLNYTDIDFPGLAGVVHSLLWPREGDDNWPARLADIFHDYELLVDRGYWSFYELIMDGGQLIRPGITVYGLKDLTTKVDANTAKIDANTAKIGTLPEGITVQGMLDGWTNDGGALANPGLKGIFGGWTLNDHYFHGLSVISDYVSMVEDAYGARFPFVFTQGSQSTTIDGVDYTGPVYPLWKLSEEVAKIGTLPSGEVSTITSIMNTYDKHYPNTVDWPFKNYPTSVQDLILSLYGPSGTNLTSIGFIPHVLGIIEDLVWPHEDMYQQFGILPTTIPFYEYDANGTLARTNYPTADVFGINNMGIMLKAILQGFSGKSGLGFLSLPEISTRTVRLSDQIGTLPSGVMQPSKGLTLLLPDTDYTYPTSIGDFMGQMYSGYLGLSGLAQAVYYGNELTGQTNTVFQVKGLRKITEEIGTLPFGITVQGMYEGWTDSESNTYLGVKGLNDKIGTLPTESTSEQSMWYRYGFVKTVSTPIELPDTIGGIFSMLFNGDSSYTGPSLTNILSKILGGFTDGGGLETYGLNRLTRGIKSITDQIGTLPDEYSTVGAALTAMDAKIDARELPSSSDDGQYVLSAKKVGDTITYTWVRMDLTNEEQAQ